MGGSVVKKIITAKREKTRGLILDKAAKLFSQRGYGSTTLKDIAADAGMQAGSLYYHFASKEALMVDVLELSIKFISDTVEKEIEKLGDETNFEIILNAFIRGHLVAILKHSDYTAATIRNNGQIPQAVQATAHAKREEYEGLWRKIMEKGKQDGVIRADIDESILRLIILGSINWSSIWYNKKGESQIDDLANTYTDIFLNGCR